MTEVNTKIKTEVYTHINTHTQMKTGKRNSNQDISKKAATAGTNIRTRLTTLKKIEWKIKTFCKFCIVNKVAVTFRSISLGISPSERIGS